MDFTSEEFRKKFPNLSRELEQNMLHANINSIQTELTSDGSKKLSGYTPNVLDFLRRCDSTEEAVEIIEFLERRGEISRVYAVKLCTQLRKKGLRSFGSKKEHGHYFKNHV